MAGFNSLPFVTAPKEATKVVGTAQTGQLEFPVFGGLTVAETAYLQQEGATSTAFSFTSKVALKIAKAEKVKPIEAHTFVAKVLAGGLGTSVEFTPDEADWQVRYLSDLEDVALKVMEISLANSVALVTTVIRHRLPGMEEWTIADTKGMPQALLEEIFVFASGEQQGTEEYDPEKAKEEVADALGKSPKAPSKKPSQRTGRKSSTSSEASTPESPSSAD